MSSCVLPILSYGQVALPPITWTAQVSGQLNTGVAVATDGTTFVTGIQSTVIVTSPDAITWTQRN